MRLPAPDQCMRSQRPRVYTPEVDIRRYSSFQIFLPSLLLACQALCCILSI